MIIAIKILGFLYKMISTRMLGLEGMRLISMIMPALALCLALSSLSIQAVCNQNVASNMNLRTTRISVIMLSCLKITLTSSSIISILMLISFPLYKYIYNDSFIYYPLLLCIPLLFCSNISGVMKGYLEANDEFSITYFSNVVESLTKILLTVILLYIFKDHSINTKAIIVFLSLALSELSSNLVLSYKIKKGRKIKLISTNQYELEVLKQAIPLTLSSLVNTLAGYITPFIFYYAAAKSGFDIIESTTYYALITSYAIPLILSGEAGIQTVVKLAFPKITKNIDNKKELNSIIDKSLIIGIVISVFSFSMYQFQTDNMLNIMYDDTLSAPIVKVLSFAYLFAYLDPIFITILQSFKKEKAILTITVITQIITMSLIFLLTINAAINTLGYVIGLAIGLVLKFIMLAIYAIYISKYKPDKTKLISVVVTSIIYMLVLWANEGLIAYIIISSIYFLLLFLLYRYLYSNRSNTHHIMTHK
ncbi:MAG: hypothetical protein E7176_02165 [Erysipelotrichaceae bacterium]|nr:hypothetical protein [Erysipelotrichaceae bacterium]